MIETNTPDINVDDIMAKIREEVAKRKEGSSQSPQPAPKSFYTSQPLPSVHWPQVSSSLKMAEHFRDVGTTNSVMQNYPKPIRWLALLMGRMILHLTQPVSYPQRRFNQSILQALQTMLDGVHELQQEISGRFDRIAALEARINELTLSINQKADKAELQPLWEQKADKAELQPLWEQKADKAELQPLWELKADKAELQPLWEQKADKNDLMPLWELKADKAELQPLWEQKVDKNDLMPLWELKADKAELQPLWEQKVDKNDLLPLWEQKVDKNDLLPLWEQKADKNDLLPLWEQKAGNEEVEQIQKKIRDIVRQIRDHKFNILDQNRRLQLLLEEARKRLPEPISTEQIENMLTEEDHLLDAMYLSFEDQFRGTREDIKERQKVYLPYLKDARAGTKKAPILDIGCGRGEWLELCQENTLIAKGVDMNRVMVSQCLEREFDVVEGDAIAFLREQKPNSFGAITGFQIVEHLPLKNLLMLLDETLRVLRPGGIVIFETPNPRNILVGSGDFYRDPTHNNPIFPETLSFLCESRGLVNASAYFMDEQVDGLVLKRATEYQFDTINDYIKISRDYSIIGYKA